ncbi:MAG: asparaginase [Rhodothermaceae bacterium TMED105]|nr:MAG: asparaginase [Rhodothermaceae bacterium TMED105]|tara:strand:+ start:2600 stop:3661 length:1062 start_codon:yes stop_codon:yes gene_type:complete
MNTSRKSFIKTLGALGVMPWALAHPTSSKPRVDGGNTSIVSNPKTLAVGSRNALRGVERAVSMMSEGKDPLDAAVEGVKIQELDPNDMSVGYGGLPNEHGVVQLDASCMHGPTKRAGAVGCLEGIKTPSEVAKAVLELTDHIMLVGEDAKTFALQLGFEEENLLTERAREAWLRWKRNLNPNDNWLNDDESNPYSTGTVHISACTQQGDIGSITTTSGLSYKIPGRVGDSPIIGAGQYCDQRVGSAGSTGRGEANIMACGSFTVVERMRSGESPEQACLSALQRVVEMTEPRLLDENGKPRFNLNYYALNVQGEFGGATMLKPSDRALDNGGGTFAAAEPGNARLEPMAWLFD